MKCPECGYRIMSVIYTAKTTSSIKRTRECPKCGNKTRTVEEAIDNIGLLERVQQLENTLSSRK